MTKKKVEREDDLAFDIVDALNKSSKEGKVAYIIGEEEAPTDLVDFVSTGNSILDIAISNRINGGISCGRITELNGLEGSGKSLIAAHMMANVQKEGGVAVLLDTEYAINEEFFTAAGIDMNKLVVGHPSTVEEIFENIEKIVVKVREKEKNNKKIIIVVDSVSGSPTRQETESGYDKDGYATGKAIILGKAMRKVTQLIAKQKIALVFTNQLRQRMNAPAFSDQWTTSGGKAVAFHASTRIRLALTGKVQNTDKQVIGVSVKATVIKNRLGPPWRTAEFTVFFDRGIDDLDSWFKFCKDKELITTSGPSCTYTSLDGNDHKFTSKTWKSFLSDNPKLKDEIYQRIADTLIMSYSSKDLTSDDVELASEEE